MSVGQRSFCHPTLALTSATHSWSAADEPASSFRLLLPLFPPQVTPSYTIFIDPTRHTPEAALWQAARWTTGKLHSHSKSLCSLELFARHLLFFKPAPSSSEHAAMLHTSIDLSEVHFTAELRGHAKTQTLGVQKSTHQGQGA